MKTANKKFDLIVVNERDLTTHLPLHYGGITYLIKSFDYPNLLCSNSIKFDLANVGLYALPETKLKSLQVQGVWIQAKLRVSSRKSNHSARNPAKTNAVTNNSRVQRT